MCAANLRILHVEAGRHFYGGTLQVAYIIEGLRRRGIENVLACPIGSELGRITAPFAEIVALPMGGDADVGLTGRLVRAIRQHRPNLVHLHSRRGADLWGGLAARLTGVPCVLSRRVDNPEPRWLVGVKYRLYDQVITISEGIRTVLIGEGVAPAKVTCVRSALDPTPWLAPVDRGAFLAEFGLPADALAIGMVAQLIPRKGHRYLLDALPRVLARFPNAHVLMFGRGPLEAELRRDIAASSLEHHVRLAGFRDDLPRWLGGLDIIVHPADMEGLGVALLQAQAAGVPVVASRVGGLPEAIEDGVTGLLTTAGDSAALATAICRVLGDPGLRRGMGAAGRARILTSFSTDSMVEGNLAVYHACLLRHRSPYADSVASHHR